MKQPLTDEIRKWFSDMGKVGGKNRSEKLSPEERHRIAVFAVRTRWDKAKNKKGAHKVNS